jgi:hypothetical protein
MKRTLAALTFMLGLTLLSIVIFLNQLTFLNEFINFPIAGLPWVEEKWRKKIKIPIRFA